MKNAKTIVITAIVTFVATTALWLLVIGGLYVYFSSSPPPFIVTLESPREVSVNEEFTLRVSVENPTDEPMELDSIDIYDSFLDGFEILAMEPRVRGTSDIFDFHSIDLGVMIAPGEGYIQTLQMVAKSEGFWAGDVDACLPNQKFVTASATVIVSE